MPRGYGVITNPKKALYNKTYRKTTFGIEDMKFDNEDLYNVIINRLKNKPKKSYVTALSRNGINKVAQKVGEEATELVIEAVKKN